MNKILEVCCGSYQDVVNAKKGGADRVELNSALALGGLTPSIEILKKIKTEIAIPVVCMVRERGAGFCYDEQEFELMLLQAKALLEAGADGIAFGFLDEYCNIETKKTKQMVELIHSYQKEAVFHRAFDCVKDIDQAVTSLIDCGVDRILTSGLGETVVEGTAHLAYLCNTYSDRIQILGGCGVNIHNVESLLNATGLTQIHSSCKSWKTDPTTISGKISYAYATGEHASCYDIVDIKKVEEFSQFLHQK